jgi:SAM-dependent methyltransferase
MSYIGPGYQPLLREGEPQDSQRDVLRRWKLLEPLLPINGVVVDVGSNYGWFGLQTCLSRPNVHVISVEPDVDCLGVQADLVEHHKLWDRMHLFSEPMSGFWVADIVDRADVVLMLSVLHWFDDPERVVREAAAVSNRIIFDHPDVGNVAAHNADGRAKIGHIVGWLEGLGLGDVEVVGRVPHHVSEHDSWMVQLWVK